MFNENVWVEKYRPKNLSEVILPKRYLDQARGYVTRGEIPNLLMTGRAGVGKTTLAIALCNELDYDYLLLNCSDEGRFLDTFRNKVANFCSSISLDGKRKCLILDEVDNVTDDVQKLLRGFTEKFSGNCAFIATCNFVNRVSEPLQSRFAQMEFTISSDEKKEVAMGMFSAVCKVLAAEEITFDKNAVSKLVGKHFPDMRRILNELQGYSSTGNIDAGIFVAASEDTNNLIGILKNKSWSSMRKWVAQQANLDLAHICRALYTRTDEFMEKGSIPAFVILASDYQYRNVFVPDKEIHVVAFLTQVMSECEFTKA